MAKKKLSGLDALQSGVNFKEASDQAMKHISNVDNSTKAQTNKSTNETKKFKAIRIDKDLHLQFKTYTASIGESMTGIVEQLITDYLNEQP